MAGMRKLTLLSIFCLATLGGLPSLQAAPSCGQDFVCHEALMKFSRHASEQQIQQIMAEEGLTFLNYFEHSRLYHVALPTQVDTLEKIDQLSRRENILAASPNGVVQLETLPNDPRFSEQWALHNTGQLGGLPGADIGMENVWDQITASPSIIVGTIDSGVDYNHPDLTDSIWVNPGEIPGNGIDDDGNGYIDDVHGYDFANRDGDPYDDDSHGTHVAGIIGATGNNGLGVSGINWKAKIMALKFLDENGFGTMADAAEATEYAIDNGAKILNNSWGVAFITSALLSNIMASDDAGIIFVAAAGNFSTDNDKKPFYPASYDVGNVVSVAAVTRFDDLASFSNFGVHSVDLGAPGEYILSTVPTWSFPDANDYEFFSGTSMASPCVVGAAALLWSAYPQYNHREIIALLLQGVAPKAYLKNITLTGGTLNLNGSFDLAAGVINRPPIANAGPDQFKKVGETVQLQASATDEDGDSPLFFEWTLSAPQGSQSQLDKNNIANPTFVPDTEGNYIASLVANDAKNLSFPDEMTVKVSGENFPPPTVVIRVEKKDGQGNLLILNQGDPVASGDTVFFDGGESSGLFPYQLIFQWTLLAKPQGSLSEVIDAKENRARLVPDMPGTYLLRLTIDDGFHESLGEISIAVQSGKDSGNGSSAASAGGCSLVRRGD